MRCTRPTSSAGVAEPLLVAVKHHGLARALDDVAPFVGPGTTFVSVLNGLDSEEVIAQRFGPRRSSCAPRRARLAWESPADMQHEMWWKFMVNACIKTSSPDARPRSTFFPAR